MSEPSVSFESASVLRAQLDAAIVARNTAEKRFEELYIETNALRSKLTDALLREANAKAASGGMA